MMPIEKAIEAAYRKCEWLFGVIEQAERETGRMCGHRRSEIGMIRCLMAKSGIEKDKLPEVPYLDPAHLEAHKKWVAERKAEKEARSEQAG